MVQHDVKCNCIKAADITAISRIRVCVFARRGYIGGDKDGKGSREERQSRLDELKPSHFHNLF